MAIVEVKVPQLSESVAEATLLQWKKKPGDAVAVDEILIEIETDKVVLEVPAPAAGVLGQLIKGDGSTVRLRRSHRDPGYRRQGSGCRAGSGRGARGSRCRQGCSDVGSSARSGRRRRHASGGQADGGRGIAAGVGRRYGEDGRVLKGDVLGAMTAGAAAPTPAAAAPAARPALPEVKAPLDLSSLSNRPEQRVPMTRLRQRVAERLVQSQSTAAILTTFNEVNMQPVMDMRNRYKDRFEKEHGVKLGFMSFFVKAAMAALKKFPVVNASIDGNDIVYHGYFDIGIAVGSPTRPGGADPARCRPADASPTSRRRSPTSASAPATASSRSRNSPAARSRSPTAACSARCCPRRSSTRRRAPSSACMRPRSARSSKTARSSIRPMNYLALSYDHRIIDGREAVLSLVTMKEALEDPARLLLEV